MTAESLLRVPDSATLKQYGEYRLIMPSSTVRKDCSSGINQIIFRCGPRTLKSLKPFASAFCSVIQAERLVPSFEEDRQKMRDFFIVAQAKSDMFFRETGNWTISQRSVYGSFFCARCLLAARSKVNNGRSGTCWSEIAAISSA